MPLSISVERLANWLSSFLREHGLSRHNDCEEQQHQNRDDLSHIFARLKLRSTRRQLLQAQKENRSLRLSHGFAVAKLKSELEAVTADRAEAEGAYHNLKRHLRSIERDIEAKDKKLADGQQYITALTNQLQLTQFRPDNPLYDDEASKMMKRLNERLSRWVLLNFHKSTWLKELTVESLTNDGLLLGDISEPMTHHERLALIHAVVAENIRTTVFDTFILGARCCSTECESWTKALAADVRKQCPQDISDTWFRVTSRAVGNISADDQDTMCTSLVNKLGTMLLNYSTTGLNPGIRHLKQLIMECMVLKRRLEGQGAKYHFKQSPAGTRYIPEEMQSMTGEPDTKTIVKNSLWPRLSKSTPDGPPHVIEREVVWTPPSLSMKQ